MENYSSNGAFIDDLLKALEETKPKTPYGWYYTVNIDGYGLVTYTLRSTACDINIKTTSFLPKLMPADYEYTKRGAEYHWHRFQIDLWEAGVVKVKPPTPDLNNSPLKDSLKKAAENI